MAQPTIYADIDCDGQVEVKINNDTGYPCTLITSTGVNESIPSTGTNVIRNYNLTSSDWVKVVAAQDVTIAANKLTGTVKYITSVTTTTPAPTTTTTTTPSGGAGALTGGTTCANRVAWPAYGVANKYQVTWSAAATPQFFQSDSTTRTFYIDNPSNTVTRKGYNGTCNQMGFNNIIAGDGQNGLTTNPTFFSIEIPAGATFPVTLDVWIV